MNKIQFILLALSLLLLTGCDQFYCIQYIINNTSDTNISVSFYDKEFNIDNNTVLVKSKQKHVIYEAFGSGKATNPYLKKITAIPLDSLSIMSSTNKLYIKNPKNISLWIKTKEGKNDSCGSIELTVTYKDFN